MRVIFIGTSDFGVKSLAEINKFHDIQLIVTQPDTKKGRGKKLQFSPIKKFGIENEIAVFQPANINSKSSIKHISDCNPELLITAAYGQFLRKSILQLPKYNCINIHASLLPKYRGAAPINYALLNNEKKTGISIFFMEREMDAGDILLKQEIPICSSDNFETLFNKLSNLAKDMIIKAIKLIEKGNFELEKQNSDIVTFSPKITKNDLNINWELSHLNIHNQIRAFSPLPLARGKINNILIKIVETEVCENRLENYDKCCNGEVCDIQREGIFVKCGIGSILLKRIIPANKKEMDAYQYFLGRKVRIGDKFEAI